jgi:hypothetical protein
MYDEEVSSWAGEVSDTRYTHGPELVQHTYTPQEPEQHWRHWLRGEVTAVSLRSAEGTPLLSPPNGQLIENRYVKNGPFVRLMVFGAASVV